MGYQTSWGSIYARIGADTSDFQAKLTQTNVALATWQNRTSSTVGNVGNTYDAFTSRGARSFLSLSSGMADLTKMSEMSATNVADSVNMMSFHFGDMAEKLHGTAGKGGNAMAAIGKAAQTASLVVGAAIAGWQIGTWISKITGLTAAFGTAKKPAEELAGAIGADAARYDQLQQQVMKLAAGLGQTAPALARNSTATKENAAALLDWVDKAVKANKEQRSLLDGSKTLADELKKLKDQLADVAHQGTAAGIAQQVQIDALEKDIAARKDWNAGMVRAAELLAKWKGSAFAALPVQEQMRQSIEAMTKHETELGAAVMKTYGILSEKQAAAALDDMQEKIRQVALAGGDAGQVMAKMGPDILQAVEDAKTFGVTLPPVMEDVALAITEKNKLWMGDLLTGLGKTPEAASAAAVASAKALDEMGSKLEGSISGGFGRGIQKGTDFAQQQLDAFRAEVEQTPITFKIEGDWTSFRDQCKKHGVNFAMDTY